MQSKTSQIETYLLNAIERGEYPPGLPIPTRHQMTQMFHCSRTIVERAIAALSADGHLESGRGRRTVVRKAVHPGSGIKRLHVISQHDCHRSLSDVFCSFVADQDYFGIPVRWIPPEKAGIMALLWSDIMVKERGRHCLIKRKKRPYETLSSLGQIIAAIGMIT